MYRRSPIFLRILDSFFRHRWLFLTALIVVSGLTMSLLILRSRTFHASALTQANPDTVSTELGDRQTNSYATLAQINVGRFNDLITNNLPGGFLDTALKNAHLATPINLDPQAADPRYDYLHKHLTAAVQSDNLWSIDLTWDNPQENEAIVKALQDQYISEIGTDKSAISTTTVSFLDKQIADTQKKMRNAEQALTAFKQTNKGQLSDAASTYASQLSSLQAQLGDKKITSQTSALKIAALQKQLNDIPKMSILEQTTADQSPMDRQINDLKAERQKLLTHETPQHPDVVAINGQIADLERQQKTNVNAPENKHATQQKMQMNPEYQSLQGQLNQTRIDAQADRQTMQNLQTQIAEYQQLLQRVPAEQRALTDKTRDYSLQTDLYNKLMQQRGEAHIKAELDRQTATSSLTRAAAIFAEPTTGRTKMIVLLLGSLLLGGLVGTVLVVLSEWSDQSLRYEGDAERLLGVPVLALLPESSDLRVLPDHGAGRKALSGSAQKSISGPQEG